MTTPLFDTHTCTISDEWTYRGMDVIWLENSLLRIGVLAGRGSDIFEFRYKPLDVDFMLRLPLGIRNPARDFSQMRDTVNQFEDYYYGGWQEILPNSPSFVYRGASLGQHGEVSLTPWQHTIVEHTPQRVAVKLWTRPLRVPVLIEKTLTLQAGSAELTIDERLTNEANTSLDLMWGHHVAFGLPFLRDGAKIATNARTFWADPSMPAPRRFKPGIELDGSLFKHVWYWQERYASQDAPWWGRAYAVALEPWTTRYDANAKASIARGDWLKLEAGESLSTQLRAAAFEGRYREA